jgi:hypothetical protein
MAVIACKVISADVDVNNVATIILEFDDGVSKWQKPYKYSQTGPIDFAGFKDMVIADLRKDLNIKNQLSNISSQVGKTFNLTI